MFEYNVYMDFKENSTNSEIRKVQGPYGECSFSIGIPRKFLNALDIKKGDYVRITIDQRERLVIRKI